MTSNPVTFGVNNMAVSIRRGRGRQRQPRQLLQLRRPQRQPGRSRSQHPEYLPREELQHHHRLVGRRPICNRRAGFGVGGAPDLDVPTGHQSSAEHGDQIALAPRQGHYRRPSQRRRGRRLDANLPATTSSATSRDDTSGNTGSYSGSNSSSGSGSGAKSSTASGRKSSTASGRKSSTASGRESSTASGRESCAASGRKSSAASGRESSTASGRESSAASGPSSNSGAGRDSEHR